MANSTRPAWAAQSASSAEAPGLIHRGFLQNAGLTHGAGPGDFVTGDLCPSKRPLDRAFFARLEAASPHAAVALSVSGLWLIHHFADFRWLVDQRNSGALDILWVDHTYTTLIAGSCRTPPTSF